MVTQLLLGTCICAACAVIQLIVVARSLRRIDAARADRRMPLAIAVVLGIVLAHFLQIGIWTLALWPTGGFATTEEAIYFAIASYTTLGYGDVLIAESARILGALAGVAGLISFGISTAFLFGAFSELLRDG